MLSLNTPVTPDTAAGEAVVSAVLPEVCCFLAPCTLEAISLPIVAGKTLFAENGKLKKESDFEATKHVPWKLRETRVHDRDSWFETILEAKEKRAEIYISGELTAAGLAFQAKYKLVRRTKNAQPKSMFGAGRDPDPGCFIEFARKGHVFDVDKADISALIDAGVDVYAKPADAAQFIYDKYLPDWVKTGMVMWHLSGSTGTEGAHYARAHFYIWLSEPMMPQDVKRMVQAHNGFLGVKGLIDPSLYSAEHVHFVADPRVLDPVTARELPDLITQRWGYIGDGPHSIVPRAAAKNDATLGALIAPSGETIPETRAAVPKRARNDVSSNSCVIAEAVASI